MQKVTRTFNDYKAVGFQNAYRNEHLKAVQFLMKGPELMKAGIS